MNKRIILEQRPKFTMLGRHHSEETKIKISLANKGDNHRKGKKHSEETKAKISRGVSGERNAFWKNGRFIDSRGYVKVYSPTHPNKDSRNRVAEHRLVMEQHLGRYLERNEQVHHKNGNRTDNRIENLELVIMRNHFGEIRCPHCLKSFWVK
jgi:hypothetical protein